MIKLNKDLTILPVSLIPPYLEFFKDRVGRKVIPIPGPSKTTHQRRTELIEKGSYIDTDVYNTRYKLTDIKTALRLIYNNKCAFCEQIIEQYHVEHYRPKSIYYWLAYSWDNLLMACSLCNEYKGNNFELDGAKVSFVNNDNNLKAINILSANYDLKEFPQLVNPEVTDPEGKIVFNQKGEISSEDKRFKYTISICKVDREILNDWRRGILDRFRENVRDALLNNESISDQLVALKTNLNNFKSDSENPKLEYLAFRRFAISNNWLNTIIKELKVG
ncbi:hypothetical protein SF1_13730 [Sphingobacterium faecium NBRC 15299]|uniref:HNH endonuclease n=1 Tax=Sphingobacterium faecium TaxID=34087 RepID=UPI000D391D1D|nr:HNH endonuclease [Sphingobacterium faecium]PTX11834.1 uncharacterized protein (TIGR02646 family) [Sphingobacterium faecium]GEM63391.1 hypothetical protein SF1_13730 [Sphingobacterium faecium NBRC 15299]